MEEILNNIEYRFAKEINANIDKNLVEGTAIRFNEESQILYEKGKLFNELVLPEAVTQSFLETQSIYVRYNHNPNTLLARFTPTSTRNSLHFTVDSVGVHFSFRMKKSDSAYLESIQNGDITSCSFGFALPNPATGAELWQKRSGSPDLRTIRKYAVINDFSLVEEAAYPNTTVSARSYDAFLQSLEMKKITDVEEGKRIQQEMLEKELKFKQYLMNIRKKYL